MERHDSQKTMISLLELDPSPIESPQPDDKHADNLITPEDNLDGSESTLKASTTSTASAPGLSGSGHGSIYYCTPRHSVD